MNTHLQTDPSDSLDSSALTDDPFDRSNPIVAVLTEASDDPTETAVNEYRLAGMRALEFCRSSAMLIKCYRGNTAFAFDCWLLAMGWFDILGVQDQVSLAARWHCERANVGKVVKKMQARLGLSPVPGQRRLEGCQHMRARRQAQLKNQSKPT
jgi:hypothetical protein